jgi:uncharacterized membrane protein YbhN (UPF0104 family)
MESVFHRALAWVRAIPPRVVIATKLAFALLAIVIVGTTVDWRTVATHLNGLFLPILAGMALMVPVLMVTAWRWKLIIGTETPRRFGFLTALQGCGLGLFINLVVPGLVGGDAARAHYASVRAQIKYPRALVVAFTERLFGLLSICLLAGIGLALNDHIERFTQIPATELTLGVVAAAAIVLAGVGLTRQYTQIPLLLFPLLLVLSVVGQSSDFLLVHIYGRAVSVDIPLETLLLVVPLVFLASVIPLTPGGHGIREVTLTALLTLAGIPVSKAALIALMLLVTKIGFGLACGVALLNVTPQLRKATQIVTQVMRSSS